MATTRRSATRLLLAMLGMGIVASLGVAVWVSTDRPTTVSHKVSVGPVPAAAARPTQQVRTSTLQGSSAGYDATVQITRTDVGAVTVTTLDVRLTTQATPASAPTAEARLVGTDHVTSRVALTIVGAGHWTSKQFTAPAGRYALTLRFDRNGGPINVSMRAVLT